MNHQTTLGDLRRAILVGIALLTATSPGSAQSLKQTKAPQEYFADRIKMEAGQPAVETIPELYDELDFQRAVQAYVCEGMRCLPPISNADEWHARIRDSIAALDQTR